MKEKTTARTYCTLEILNKFRMKSSFIADEPWQKLIFKSPGGSEYGKEGNGKLKRTAETDDGKWAWSHNQDPKTIDSTHNGIGDSKSRNTILRGASALQYLAAWSQLATARNG